MFATISAPYTKPEFLLRRDDEEGGLVLMERATPGQSSRSDGTTRILPTDRCQEKTPSSKARLREYSPYLACL